MTRVLLSYAYPPFEAPRAVQVERLARHLDGPVEVLRGDVERVSGPPPADSAATGADDSSPRVVHVPWSWPARAVRTVMARGLRGRLDVPDRYLPWAVDAARALRRRPWHPGDVLVSFGQPWSDHVAALLAVRRAGVPWVAHFSDPWTENPLRSLPAALGPVDRRLEAAVLQRADRLVFTNGDALELVLEGRPATLRAKARVVPHAFRPRAGDGPPRGRARPPGAPLVARHLGAFYGRRSPAPLLAALRDLARRDPSALGGLRVELVGPVDRPPDTSGLPAGLVHVLAPVGYEASLDLMAAADLLLVIDAPAPRSPFLPSKLVDYVGAGRPIAALSPPGPAADLVRRLGGWVADPESGAERASALAAALRAARDGGEEPWGHPDVRAEYRPDRVAAAIAAILAEAVAAGPGPASTT